MSRRYNHRNLRIHRNYTYGEISRKLHISKKTIRNWIVKGLPVLNDQRPFLIQGKDLVDFLKHRRVPQRPCALNELYCFKCRRPNKPFEAITEYLPLTPLSGQLKANCASCKTVTYKNISLAQVDLIKSEIKVNFPKII